MPIPPQQNATNIPQDDQLMLNLVFLKYVTVGELSTLLSPFLGEGASTWAYAPANLLLILDSRRNMGRLMDLVSLFDSNTLASQRVRVFDVEHGRPSDIVKELENILQFNRQFPGSESKRQPRGRATAIAPRDLGSACQSTCSSANL